MLGDAEYEFAQVGEVLVLRWKRKSLPKDSLNGAEERGEVCATTEESV